MGLKEKFKNAQWEKYKDLCDVETRFVPISKGERQVALCQIIPKGPIMESNKAYIYAHQGGGLMFDLEMFILEGFRTAVLFKT